jgi:hypothetical protein
MIASPFTNHGRSGVFTILGLVGLLAAASVLVQSTRDRWYHTDQPAEQILYVQSVETMRRMALSYDALLSDVYWIRAIQHFGRERLTEGQRNYPLLFPLLDMTTSLDGRFNIAYRFGSLFLAEPPPGGPGRPDLAIKLLEKGIKEMPTKWEYYQDTGFVYYFGYKDYAKAGEWFRRGGELKGAPWFLKSLAANTLAKGHDRKASRLMYQVIAETADNDFMKKDAIRRLRQLDTMDFMDRVREAVRRYRANGQGSLQLLTWQTLLAARILRAVPEDGDGFALLLDPVSGDVRLDPKSTLFPLPTESPDAAAPPDASASPSTAASPAAASPVRGASSAASPAPPSTPAPSVP